MSCRSTSRASGARAEKRERSPSARNDSVRSLSKPRRPRRRSAALERRAEDPAARLRPSQLRRGGRSLARSGMAVSALSPRAAPSPREQPVCAGHCGALRGRRCASPPLHRPSRVRFAAVRPRTRSCAPRGVRGQAAAEREDEANRRHRRSPRPRVQARPRALRGPARLGPGAGYRGCDASPGFLAIAAVARSSAKAAIMAAEPIRNNGR